jgi:hypothetical protein
MENKGVLDNPQALRIKANPMISMRCILLLFSRPPHQ